MTQDEKEELTDRMNALVEEMAPLKPNDPRRVEIIKELSRLSLQSAALKEQNTNG
jgi:hypothetical protein